MACKHENNGQCICRESPHRLCAYCLYSDTKDHQPECEYYEASLDEVMSWPIYDIKTK